ncbi:hypothetical protein B9Z55_022904 [Caenorhabditis nigoni]|uniref:Uncharacterized protein n=1 Tax=Caenorhabditis nigoni TaxID=1611254 RepID=A0A2G5SN08_9PELO|nr:hypothetical protein B9Z55_022904 [Caenorhabditis nigoni]
MMDQGKAEGIIQEYKDFKKMIQKNRIQPVRDLPLFDGELWRKAILANETMDQAPVGATTSRDAVVTIPGTNQDAETRAATRDDTSQAGTDAIKETITVQAGVYSIL